MGPGYDPIIFLILIIITKWLTDFIHHDDVCLFLDINMTISNNHQWDGMNDNFLDENGGETIRNIQIIYDIAFVSTWYSTYVYT